MIREWIREGLKKKRLARFEGELKEQRIGFDAWQRAREREGANGQKPSLRVVFYDELKTFLASEEPGRLTPEEPIIFCRREGRLSENALFLCENYARAHGEVPLFYGDEDRLMESGEYADPYLKPDWSPDTFLSAFYIGSLFAVRAGFLEKLTGSEGFSPETDADPDRLFFLLARQAGGFEKREGKSFPVGHIREVLFHLEEKEELFLGRGHETEMEAAKAVRLPVPSGELPLLSIIIPSKDHPELLKTCVSSLHACGSEGLPYELIVVDNGSSGENRKEIEECLNTLPKDKGLRGTRYLYRPMDFHFSRMCNMGAESAAGELLLFLNDDIEALEPDWLMGPAALALQERIGAVGVKLLYPGGDLIQHAGITNVRLGPVHKLSRLSDASEWYFGRNRGVHDCIAVTGACLMLQREKYDKAGGFTETLPVAFNDVELCYHLFEMGYDNVQDNRVRAYHHESFSRGLDTEDPAKIKRMAAEYDILMKAHPAMYHYDPYYHPFLIEDEHTSVFVFYRDALVPGELPLLKPRAWKNNTVEKEYAHGREDACLRLGVEYAGPLEKWEEGISGGNASSGYYIKGYSFVIGSDNICYERRLLLQRTEEEGFGEVFEVPVTDWYRPDIRLQTADQLHTEMCGFKVRISRESLRPGEYRLGMLSLDQTSRTRLAAWVPNVLVVS